MSDEIRSIWLYPEGGAVTDLSVFANATSIADVEGVAVGLYESSERATEQQTEQTMAMLRGMQENLVEKGFDFDVDRMMRPSLGERFQMAVDDAVDWVRGAERSEAEYEADSGLFPFGVPIAQTRPTNELSFEYEEIYGETARLRAEIAQTLARARAGTILKITIPDAVYDAFEELDDGSDEQYLLWMLGDVSECIPPHDGKLGFLLSERQEDGGMPIEIDLIVLTTQDYERIQTLVTRAGGSIN